MQNNPFTGVWIMTDNRNLSSLSDTALEDHVGCVTLPHEGPSLLGGPSTSSPLDRAAQALENLDSSDFHERQTKDYTEMARAVLKAIREPSGGMILAANLEDIQSMHSPEAEITCWQTMIDAALNQ